MNYICEFWWNYCIAIDNIQTNVVKPNNHLSLMMSYSSQITCNKGWLHHTSSRIPFVWNYVSVETQIPHRTNATKENAPKTFGQARHG